MARATHDPDSVEMQRTQHPSYRSGFQWALVFTTTVIKQHNHILDRVQPGQNRFLDLQVLKLLPDSRDIEHMIYFKNIHKPSQTG